MVISESYINILRLFSAYTIGTNGKIGAVSCAYIEEMSLEEGRRHFHEEGQHYSQMKLNLPT